MDATASHDEQDIDPNEFDNLLCRSESITTSLGIEATSQENAMLRGPRKYSSFRSSSTRRPSHVSSIQSKSVDNYAVDYDIEEAVKDDDHGSSPYLNGVSVPLFWFVFGGVLCATLVSCFDSTLMVSSHPVITSYFESANSANSASWLSTAFLLTSTPFQPIFGRLSDTIGQKAPYIFSALVFIGATIWCAMAQSMTSFIVVRAVCGLGAGGTMTLDSVIPSDLVQIEIRGAYQFYINIAFGIGSASGAALGGAICDNLAWRTLGLLHVAEKKSFFEAMKVFDFKGSILLTTSVTFLILGLNLGGNVLPWSHPLVIASLAMFAICCPLYVYIELKVDLPIIPLSLLTKYPRSGLIFSSFTQSVIVNSITFNVPIYFQAVLLESATSSGLRLTAPCIAVASTGTATGFLITWTRCIKWLLVLGVIFCLIGLISMSSMQRGWPGWVYVLCLIPSNIAQGFVFPANVMAVLAVPEQAEMAVVTSTLILWRSMGMVLGVALSSLVFQNTLYLYLEQNVSGPARATVIEEVRKSVKAIAGLEAHYHKQLIDSYASSLRITFMMTVLLSLIAIALTLPLRLPKLGQRKKT